MGNVGCHLWDDGDFHIALHVSGEECNQFGILSYVATHTALTHLWTGVVQFYSIATGILSHLGELNPVFLGLSHNAGNDHFLRIVLLEAVEDVEIHFVGILGKLFHVTETDERRSFLHRVEARRDLPDFLLADGLVEYTCPTGIEGPCHHLVVGADGRGSEEEGILARNSAEGDGKTGIRTC